MRVIPRLEQINSAKKKPAKAHFKKHSKYQEKNQRETKKEKRSEKVPGQGINPTSFHSSHILIVTVSKGNDLPTVFNIL